MYLECAECGMIDFDARFALHYTGESCCDPQVIESEPNTMQLEFSDFGKVGKWCRNGVCSIVERPCQCKPVYVRYFRSKFGKRS